MFEELYRLKVDVRQEEKDSEHAVQYLLDRVGLWMMKLVEKKWLKIKEEELDMKEW